MIPLSQGESKPEMKWQTCTQFRVFRPDQANFISQFCSVFILVFLPPKEIRSLLGNGLALVNTSYYIKVQHVLTMRDQVTSLSYPACQNSLSLFLHPLNISTFTSTHPFLVTSPFLYILTFHLFLFCFIMSLSSKRKPADNPLSLLRPSKRWGIMPPKAPKKVKQDIYHLKREDIPEDVGGFKVWHPYFLFNFLF